jgi:hypothetical protein
MRHLLSHDERKELYKGFNPALIGTLAARFHFKSDSLCRQLQYWSKLLPEKG